MIENYIVELLFEQECVIIPGFGGFVVNYQAAYYDTKKNIFFPPQRKVSFNARLKTNDGLLYNYLVHRENISFNEAREKVSRFVETINARLKKKEKVTILNIGTFTFKHQLVFLPDRQANFLSDVYGLNAVLISSIKKEAIVVPNRVIIPVADSTYNYRKWMVAASFLLSLLLIPHSFLNFQKYHSQSNLGFDFSMQDVNSPLENLLTDYPFLSGLSSQIDELSDKKSALNPFAEVKSSTEVVQEMNKETILPIAKDTAAIQEQEVLNSESQIEDMGTEKIIPETISDKVSEEIQPGSFCLIIGSFKEKRNAERFFKKKQKDFPNAIFFQFNGFYRITSDVFAEKSDASKEKKILKSKGISSWVMKY